MRFVSKLAAIAAGTLALLSLESEAYTPAASKWDPRSLPITYVVNANSAPASLGAPGAIAAVNAGFASWAAPACTTWRATNGGASALTRARTGDAERSVLWIQGPPGTWPGEFGSENSTIGVTTPVWRNPGYFIDADIQFNAVGFRWGDGSGGTVDTQSIAVHEEGHFLGLDHTNVRGAVMFPSYSGGQTRNLSADDQGGVCFLYPSGMMMVIPDAGMMAGGGAVGDVCNAGAPCAAGNRCVCRSQNDCFCSRPCSGASPCPNSFQCVNTNVGQLCVPGGGMMMGMGTGRTGDPCTGGGDCSTGVCVRGPNGQPFCSQVCTDDCSCPNAFTCVPTSVAGTSVCAAGNNTCMADVDSGVSDPDSGVVSDVPTARVMDGGRPDGGYGVEPGGCRCSTPGRDTNSSTSGSARVVFALAAAATVSLLKRRVRS